MRALSSVRQWLMAAVFGIGGLLGIASHAAQAQESTAALNPLVAASQPAAAPLIDTRDTTLFLHNRRIVSFQAPLAGRSPARRAEMAQVALQAALIESGPGVLTHTAAGDRVRFELDGNTLFFLLEDDAAGLPLDAAARAVEGRLRTALREAREMSSGRALGIGAAWAAGALITGYLVIRLLLMVRRRAILLLTQRLQQWQQRHPAKTVLSTYADHASTGVQWTVNLTIWGLVLLICDITLTFVLRQFAYTRPWGERSTVWLLEVLQQFALSAAGAVPGLVIAALIFVLARLATKANSLFTARVERGEVQLSWLDIDTAGPTRRLGNVVIWLFALAMAYPYLPGANSEAFKGVTVLAGLMLSLGASGVVGQAMSGLSLMYSRSLRVGEYVKIGDTEGTVTALGMFATKLHTGLGEEVSLPNAVIFSQPVRNFSRLVNDGQFVLHTAVTIGYSTPWRQVHALLLEAARRSPGVAQEPPPYVVQTALSDFYVEYRLCAQSNKSAPRRRAEAMNQLHGHIQDVFNEHGVQIMSPHYRADPPEPQVVPPADWWKAPATRPADAASPPPTLK